MPTKPKKSTKKPAKKTATKSKKKPAVKKKAAAKSTKKSTTKSKKKPAAKKSAPPLRVKDLPPAKPGPQPFARHRLVGAKKKQFRFIDSTSIAELFAQAPAGIDASVLHSVYLYSDDDKVFARFELDFASDPAATEERTLKASASIKKVEKPPLFALSSDGKELFFVRWVETGPLMIEVLDPVSLTEKRTAIPLGGAVYFDEHYSRLRPAGPGMLCYKGPHPTIEASLFLIDTQTGALLGSETKFPAFMLSTWHHTAEPSSAHLVVAGGDRVVVLRAVRDSAEKAHLVEVASAAQRAGSIEMLDVGPSPAELNTDNFAILSLGTPNYEGVVAQRWIVHPNDTDTDRAISPAGMFACEDMTFDPLYRTLCLGAGGQVIGCWNDGNSCLTWGSTGVSSTVVPVGEWTNYRVVRCSIGTGYFLFGGGDVLGFPGVP